MNRSIVKPTNNQTRDKRRNSPLRTLSFVKGTRFGCDSKENHTASAPSMPREGTRHLVDSMLGNPFGVDGWVWLKAQEPGVCYCFFNRSLAELETAPIALFCCKVGKVSAMPVLFEERLPSCVSLLVFRPRLSEVVGYSLLKPNMCAERSYPWQTG